SSRCPGRAASRVERSRGPGRRRRVSWHQHPWEIVNGKQRVFPIYRCRRVLPSLVRAGRRSSMPTVVFDLDGTLVDTAPDLVATLNQILAREGLPPVDYGVARKMIGGGARALIERGLLADGRPPEQSIDRLVADFIDLYASQIAERSQPF